MAEKEKSKSQVLKEKLTFAAFKILKENGGELAGRELMDIIDKELDLDDWATERYEKTGNTRWKSILHFASIACVKAGFLVKRKGIWSLTQEGENAMAKGEKGLYADARREFRKWKKENKTDEIDDVEDEPLADENHGFPIDQIEQIASEGLKNHIESLNPYEFQDLSAALLRGMGYFTPYVSARGKDGGLDIIAYKDPLGTISPRIKVQVKHRGSSASVQEVRQLMGLLQKDGDIGIFISSGGFTPDAKTTARSSNIHVELIDLNRFINLWQDFYQKLTDEDKSLMPLLPVYFLAPDN